jgi:S-adenosylmethionine-diacylglycerol 3-amino-3-carboxypropyl transferase
MALYDRHIRPHLDEETRRLLGRTGSLGRRRISRFTRGFYSTGLLGRFISAAHLFGQAVRRRSARTAQMDSVEKQREFFDTRIAPVFDSRSFKALTSLRASLFGLGIPPAQYEALAGDAKTA